MYFFYHDDLDVNVVTVYLYVVAELFKEGG